MKRQYPKRTNIAFSLSDESESYIVKCARIRDVSVTFLITRLINTIAADQMCEAILDDDGHRYTPGKGHHRFHYKARGYPL